MVPKRCINFRAFSVASKNPKFYHKGGMEIAEASPLYPKETLFPELSSLSPKLLDVLDLLAELLDLDLDFDGSLADSNAQLIEARRLGQNSSDFAIHLLKDEIHALSDLVLQILQSGELIEVAAE